MDSRQSWRRFAAAVIISLIIANGLPAFSGSVAADGTFVGDGVRAQAKWTYLVYISADNNLEDEAILNVNQMEVVGSSDDLAIVIQFDRSPDYDGTNGNWTGTRRYYVTGDSDPDIINSQLLEDMGELDMGDGDNLRDFVIWGIENYPADRYYLDVWGHGGGWRDGTCNDYTSGSVIDTDELGIAMTEARHATNVTLDGVGFDQCLMAQMEVYYEIKATADVLVGAETLIPSEGYNYTRVLEPLAADPDMDGRELGEVLVSAFFDEYGHNNERAHSAADAEELDANLTPAVNWLAQLLRGVANSLHDEIKWARDTAQTYRTIDYIDLGNFTEKLLIILPENETEIRQAAIDVLENVSTTVISEDHGIGRNGSTGLSFYFPEWGVAWSYAKTALAREQRWDEFLDAYFDRRDRPNIAPSVEVTAPAPGSVVGMNFTIEGKAADPDGNVTGAEFKLDRDPWIRFPAGAEWSWEVDASHLTSGFHRVSVRSRDASGDYSREDQFRVLIDKRGLALDLDPDWILGYADAELRSSLEIRSFGDAGGLVDVEVSSAPVGWSVILSVTSVDLPANTTLTGDVGILVPVDAPKGEHVITIRTSFDGAGHIQAFAHLTVNVTDPWPALGILDMVFNPKDPTEGVIVETFVVVENLGVVESVPTNITIVHTMTPYYEENETLNETFIIPLGSVSPGSTWTPSLSWTAEIGTHNFVVTLDPAGINEDLFSDDNRMTLTHVVKGFDVSIEASQTTHDAQPGDTVTITLYPMNTGNLRDILNIEVMNTTMGWYAQLSNFSVILEPRKVAVVDLVIEVPEVVLGGDVEVVTVRLRSQNDPTKQVFISLTVRVPEEFGLVTTLDASSALVPHLGTVSFNMKLENEGNGYDNYTLEYVHQTDNLLVTAVNDSMEVSPGDESVIEIFVSHLGTATGGETFDLRFTVRSTDDPGTWSTVWFFVTVERVFNITVDVLQPSLTAVPGSFLSVSLEIANDGNYPISLEAMIEGDDDLYDTLSVNLGKLESGLQGAYQLNPVLNMKVPVGQYTMVLTIREKGETLNHTTILVPLSIAQIDRVSFTLEEKTEVSLAEGGSWNATMLLHNDGNHPEIYDLEVSGVPGWMTVELSEVQVTLPAYGSTEVSVTVTISNVEAQRIQMVMLAVRASPGNFTGTTPTIILDVPVDPHTIGEGSTWFLWTTLVLVLLVVVVTLVLFRRWR